MAQPYTDWELTDAKNYGIYSYEIYRVVRADGTQIYKGVVSWPNKDSRWLESETYNGVRMGLITLGQQGA